MDYIIGDPYINDNNAGVKARLDVDTIFSEMYPESIVYRKSKGGILPLFPILYRLKNVRKDDIVMVQFPCSNPLGHFILVILLCMLRFLKKNKTVVLIHDIEAIRTSDKNIFLNYEYRLLSRFDYVISPNKRMTELLRKKGIKTQILEQEIWDYLYDGPYAKNGIDTGMGYEVVFAGNLSPEKSPFLEHLPDYSSIRFNLYGSNYKYSGGGYIL